MEISMFEAIKNVAKDKTWILKTLVVGYIMFIGSFLYNIPQMKTVHISLSASILLILVAFIINLYVTGFDVKTLNNYLNSDEAKLPNLLCGSHFLSGLWCVLAYLVYWLMFLIPIFIIAILIISIQSFLAAFLTQIFVGNAILPVIISMIPFSLILILAIIYVGIFVNIVYIFYSKNLSFKQALSVKKIFRVIVENHHACWSLFGKTLLLGISTALLILAFAITIVGILFIPSLYIYSSLAMKNLLAQFARKINIFKYY